jgi:hypothetical protein
MTFDDIWITLFCIAGIGAGIYWFFKGLRGYRHYRFLADTPEVPIRSMPMGLVRIHGKARGEKSLLSPVTRTPCLYYVVEIDRCETDDEGHSGPWRHYLTDSNGVDFHLWGASGGKVRIDAHGARLDMPRSIRCRTGQATWVGGFVDLARNWKSLTAPHSLPAMDEDLRAYVGSLAPASGGDYRLTEFCLQQGHWYDILGTCVENPNPQDENDHKMIAKGENNPTYLISFRSEQNLQVNLRGRALGYIFAGAGCAVFCLAVLLSNFGGLRPR